MINAHEWVHCPKCTQEHKDKIDKDAKAIEAMKALISNSYRVVDQDAYHQLQAKLVEMETNFLWDKDSNPYSMKQMVDIGTDDRGYFTVNYYAYCDKPGCGFKVAHKHTGRSFQAPKPTSPCFPKCTRIGGCLLTIGHDSCCCLTGTCDLDILGDKL